jgi:hypothetical protein
MFVRRDHLSAFGQYGEPRPIPLGECPALVTPQAILMRPAGRLLVDA